MTSIEVNQPIDKDTREKDVRRKLQFYGIASGASSFLLTRTAFSIELANISAQL